MSEPLLAELQQKAGELEAALRQMRGELARLDAIEEDVEDLFAALDERAAADAPMHVKYRGAEGYPYGPLWNFGVTFEGLSVTVHGGVLYHAGKARVRGEPVGADIASLADGDLVCLIITDGGAISVATRSGMDDSDGDFVRVLFKASVTGDTASIAKWYGAPSDLGAKGSY